MDGMDDLIKEFLVESYENLDRLDQDFVALETDPTAIEKLQSIFRTIHTIKGTCGCLGFPKLERVAHVGENLLSRLREGELVMDTAITTGLLQLVDAVREILNAIEQTGTEGEKEYDAVKATLVKLNERPTVGEGPVEAAVEATPEPEADAVAAALAKVAADPSDEAAIEAAFNASVDAMKAQLAAEEAAKAAAAVAIEAPAPVAAKPAAVEPAAEAHEAEAPTAKQSPQPQGEGVAGNAIRVDVGLLDRLMNLVGELVLARNQVLQHTGGAADTGLLGASQRLNLITSELQEQVMKTRMQPIGNLWNKLPRIVRDVSTACGKKVRLEMEGKETELDRTILEAIKDPLTHVIRNSIDHGIEPGDKRVARGKGEEGLLRMRAYHEGGQVIIEIEDDGKGIDPDVIKRKAAEKGLITAEQAGRMGEREAINLIFAPGFSTAEKVTNVSGRGVGMDVVKTNVEKIGGAIDIKSRVGLGTTLRMKIPLTLAIIPALVVTTAGERFAIPQVNLLELVRLEENDANVERINGTRLYRLRGNLLPLVSLNDALGLVGERPVGATSTIVVLRGGERQFGLVVDQVNDTEEIVVKPLGKQLKGLHAFAGATIMGDGKVALILDVLGLAQQAHVVSPNGGGGDAATAGADKAERAESSDREKLLLVQAGADRMAIPLSTVARLEEFGADALEQVGGETVVQYRGRIMPVLDVASIVGAPGQGAENGRFPVVVFARGERNVGLRIGRILDVVEERVSLEATGTRAGVLGTAILREHVTALLDVQGLLDNAFRTVAA